MAVKPIPDGFHSVTPYLMASGVAKLLDFLQRALDAKVIERMDGQGGIVNHAQVQIGNSMVMMGEAHGEWKASPAALYLYVPDVDAAYKRAVAAGGVPTMEPTNQFYGDRHGGVKDPAGNTWWIATHIEDVSHDELVRRHDAMMKPKS